MQHKDQIIEYYGSGRYECDYQFHVWLHQVLRELNVYEWQSLLQNQIQILKKIKQLAQVNSNCLQDDYDDEEGVCQTFKIKSLINQLNAKGIRVIMEECQSLRWQSYEAKIYKKLAGQSLYLPVIKRIQETIHSEQFRIDSMLFTAFFAEINGGELNQCVQLYSQAIQYYLNFLTNQKNKLDSMLEASQYSNICKLPKVKGFIGTLYFILKICLRFCEIIKILTGKNNLSLKFTVLKKEIQKLVKQYQEWKLNQKQDIFKQIKPYKQHLKSQIPMQKNEVCRWCFKHLNKGIKEHSFCLKLILKKQLFK